MIRAATSTFSLFLVLLALQPKLTFAKDIMYIFDASGSMWEQMQGKTKVEIARDVFGDQIPSLADQDIRVGLIAYGHRQRGNCGDIEQLVALKPINEQELLQKINSIKPKGKTPIAASLRLATETLRSVEGEATIVLLSDGKENCDPDPCQAVRALKELGIEFSLHVIGFDVDQEERRQLQCLARVGGGRFFEANNVTELTTALSAVAPEQPITKYQENIEIIIDNSTMMNSAFDGVTKTRAAIDSVNQVLEKQAPDRDNLALRDFGGPCTTRNTSLLVDFGVNSAVKIKQSLYRMRPAGDATLASAVISAASDFEDPRRFDGVNKRVVIVTGSDDDCSPTGYDEIYQTLKQRDIKPDFYLIGMAIPPDKQNSLKRVAGAMQGSFNNVQTRAELVDLLKRIVEVEPVRGNIDQLSEIAQRIVDKINKVTWALNQKDIETAEEELSKASKEMEDSKLPFEDLGNRRERQVFVDLYEIAVLNRDLQHKMIDLSGVLIDHAKADNIDEYNKTVHERNTMVNQYNTNITRTQGILNDCCQPFARYTLR